MDRSRSALNERASPHGRSGACGSILRRAYFLPIHRDEMDRNPELVQNPGY